MEQLNEEQIKSAIEQIWANKPKDADWYPDEPDDIEIYTVSGNDGEIIEYHIKLSAMYEPPTLNLYHMMELAKVFGTMNINDDDRFSRGGCCTCDYGSCYGYTLTIRP